MIEPDQEQQTHEARKIVVSFQVTGPVALGEEGVAAHQPDHLQPCGKSAAHVVSFVDVEETEVSGNFIQSVLIDVGEGDRAVRHIFDIASSGVVHAAAGRCAVAKNRAVVYQPVQFAEAHESGTVSGLAVTEEKDDGLAVSLFCRGGLCGDAKSLESRVQGRAPGSREGRHVEIRDNVADRDNILGERRQDLSSVAEADHC